MQTETEKPKQEAPVKKLSAEAPATGEKPQKLSWLAMAKSNPLFLQAGIFAIVLIIADQISKHWIYYGIRLQHKPFGQIDLTSFFDLTFVQNKGVSFGLFAGGMTSRVILSTLSIIVALGLIHWLAKIKRPILAFGIGAIIAGALGNAYDRIIYGWVIDFLDFSGLGFPFVFNVADMCINLGVILIIIDMILDKDDEKDK